MPTTTHMPYSSATDYDSELRKLERQRAMAQYLQGQSMEPSRGGMAGRVYVGPAWTQGLAKMLQAYQGKKGMDQADTQEQELTTQRQAGISQALGDYQRTGDINALLNNSETRDYAISVIKGEKDFERQKSLATHKAELTNQFPGAAADMPSSVREWEYFQKLDPEKQDAFLTMKRASPWLNTGSQFQRPSPSGTGGVTGTIEKDLPPEKEPDYLADVAAGNKTATEQAAHEAELAQNRPKAEMKLSGKSTQVDMLNREIDEAKEMATGWTTGLAAQIFSGVGGTDAHNLAAKMDTIKANIGFDKLQEMRDSSPTGGALGQVSELENRLLQSTWGALQQSQSKEEFISNLEKVKEQVNQSWERIYKAYEQDYGVPHPDFGMEMPTGDYWTPGGDWKIEAVE